MVKFVAKEVIATKGVQTSYHGRDVSEYKMVGNPTDFTITHLLSGRDGESKSIAAEVSFWITPNVLLQPATVLNRSYTGKVEVETVWQFDLQTDPDTAFHFNQHYRYYDSEEGDTATFSELVADVTLSEPADSAKIFETLHTLDGVLLLASFAAEAKMRLSWMGSLRF